MNATPMESRSHLPWVFLLMNAVMAGAAVWGIMLLAFSSAFLTITSRHG